jgi:hypothetical protein
LNAAPCTAKDASSDVRIRAPADVQTGKPRVTDTLKTAPVEQIETEGREPAVEEKSPLVKQRLDSTIRGAKKETDQGEAPLGGALF